jgi:hypothetical protein
MKSVESSKPARSRGMLLFVGLATVALALYYCLGPPVYPNSCVAKRAAGKYTATVGLTNVSFKSVASGYVLVQAYVLAPEPHLENRLYDFDAIVGPLDWRTIDAQAADNISYYDFKDTFSAWRGCEIEMIRFTDGSRWEMGSPM